MTTIEKLIKYKDLCLNINKLEKHLEIPRGALSKAIHGGPFMPKHRKAVELFFNVLKKEI
jgi:hypothetical protein